MLFSHLAHSHEEQLSLPAGDPTFPALAYISLCEPSLAMLPGVEMEMSYGFTQNLFTPGCCKVLSSGFFIFFPCVAASCLSLRPKCLGFPSVSQMAITH